MNAKHISLAISAVAFAVLLSACTKNEDEELADLELSSVCANETKAVIDGTAFPTEGEIGLSLFKDKEAVRPYGESGYANVKYSYNPGKGKWTAGPSIKVGSETGCRSFSNVSGDRFLGGLLGNNDANCTIGAKSMCTYGGRVGDTEINDIFYILCYSGCPDLITVDYETQIGYWNGTL